MDPPLPRPLLVPFLGAFDFPATILGVPSFLAAVFLLWAVLVYVLSAASRRAGE